MTKKTIVSGYATDSYVFAFISSPTIHVSLDNTINSINVGMTVEVARELVTQLTAAIAESDSIHQTND